VSQSSRHPEEFGAKMILEKGKIQQNQSLVVRLRLRKQPSATERSQPTAWSDRGILHPRFKNRFSCPNLASQPGREPQRGARRMIVRIL
jgi:hypothetical protein